jgi:hypothetical protein
MTTLKKARAKWTAMLAIAGISLAGAANAGPMTWTDTRTENQLVTLFTPALFTHDITDGANGFNTATDDVYSYGLTFNLFDDQDRSGEHAVFTTVLDFVSGNFVLGEWFNLGGTETGAASVGGRIQLETTGRLSVIIASLGGDFYLGSSTLTVKGVRNSSVPEPGTLALFGAALLGFGLVRRKRAA